MESENMIRATGPSGRQSGFALSLTLHFVLLLLVLGQVVYLASRHRGRFDATSDELYSLTESTRRIVGGLEKRLVVEAYFSPQEDLPAELRNTRVVLDNFLDEIAQLGKGKVVVKRFNPIDDKNLQDTCTRIGIKPIDTQSATTTAVGVSRHWQGLRLLYDGGKQKVIEQIAPAVSFLAEAMVTPAIKEVVTKERRKIGFMEWPSAIPGQQGQAVGWDTVRTMQDVAKRYDFQNYKDAEGALVPEEVQTLVLFRPMDLTDRQKYVVDQFLMRGGTLVLFSDVADYGLQPNRQCSKSPMGLDAKDSIHKWQDQLMHYGIDQPGQIVADLAPQAGQAQNPMAGYEYLGLPVQMGMVRQVAYPYFFHAVDGDWSQPQIADKLATTNGKIDQEMAAYFRRTLRPGIDTDEFLFKAFRQFKRGPGMYWPCLMKLRSNGAEPSLPEGVTGRVLLWSSPLTIVEDPQASLNALMGRDLQSQAMANAAFNQKLQQRLQSEPRRQAPLMMELSGSFSSFFAGKPRPKKSSEIKEEQARQASEEAGEKLPEDPSAKDPDVGPPAPKPEKPGDPVAAAPADPATLERCVGVARIVALADSDFVRDDFTRGVYRQQGGPNSIFGAAFFPMLLDWLSQDRDLVALQSRLPRDRKISLLGDQVVETGDRRDVEKQLRTTRSGLVIANVAGPCALVLVLGLVVMSARRSQKRRFLESLDN